MKENYLRFMACLLHEDSPFFDYCVSVRRTYIDVIINSGSTIGPSDIEWLKQQLVGGRWWISTNDNRVQIVIRFDDDE